MLANPWKALPRKSPYVFKIDQGMVDIHRWVSDYRDVEGTISLVTLEEIAANDNNLNIPRYVEPKVTGQVLTVEEAMERLRESAEAAFAAEERLIGLLQKELLLDGPQS
jgi:type I restriction enzyme M protein